VIHAIPGRGPVAEALRAGRTLEEVVVDLRSSDALDALAATAATAGVAVRRADRAVLDDLSGGVLHQGVVALAGPFRYTRLRDFGETHLVVVLDGVTDPQNLGAIARSAEAAGAGGLVLRERRGAHVTPAAEKASAGALSWLPVAMVPNVVWAIADLAERGFWSVGLAGEAEATLWDAPLLDGPCAVVIGAEGSGLSRLVRERVDALIRIPMAGSMTSLNASAASAVALFEVVRRRHGAEETLPVRSAH
jgi:23S rRNA (guanosine2251-2'-O)-methyltransferase